MMKNSLAGLFGWILSKIFKNLLHDFIKLDDAKAGILDGDDGKEEQVSNERNQGFRLLLMLKTNLRTKWRRNRLSNGWTREMTMVDEGLGECKWRDG